MFPKWHRVCMLISEPHRACILNFALDRVRVRVIAARDSKQDGIELAARATDPSYTRSEF
jgi:hypothetical protein